MKRPGPSTGEDGAARGWRGAARRAAVWPFRRGRWLAPPMVLFVLPWLYMAAFTPAAGRVELPLLEASVTRRVWVVVGSYHSAVVVEQPEGWALGPPGDEAAPLVEYGWGDRRFFMESNFWPHALFATLFLPTESVVYVRGHAAPPAAAYPQAEVFVRECDGREVRRLVGELELAFVRREDGARVEAHPSVPDYAGRFYPGREYYVFWSNCNTWTVRTLEEAGFDASSALVISKRQVGGRLKGFIRVAPGAT